MDQSVFYQILDGDNLQAKSLSHLLQLRHTGHGAVVVDDFNESAGRGQASQPCQVHRSLGVSGTHQHTAVASTQRVDVTRTAQVVRSDIGIGQSLDSGSTVVHRHTGGATLAQQVDGNSEGGSQQRRVVMHLHVEVQFSATLFGDRGTEHTTTIFEHEIHMVRRYFFCRHDEIALVLAVLVVDNNDKFACLEVFDSLFYRVQFKFHISLRYLLDITIQRCKCKKKCQTINFLYIKLPFTSCVGAGCYCSCRRQHHIVPDGWNYLFQAGETTCSRRVELLVPSG